MKILTATWVVLLSSSVLATDLNVSVQSGGQNSVKVAPGARVSYSVVGELSDSSNQGLAMFAIDLSFGGGALAPANTPTSGSMLNFVSPLGLNNPAGFGGTVVGGVLRQVGGAQNTINSVFAPYPTGSVVTGIGLPGSPVTLATGTLTAPTTPGTYTLSASNLFANAIAQGTTGFPFWAVDAAGAGTTTNLSVEVQSLTGDVDTLSISGAPLTQTLSLDAGPAQAGRLYWLVGSISGTSPGLVFPWGTLPLNYDGYTEWTIINVNTPLLSNSLNFLDAQGKSTATFNLPGGLSPSLAGITLNHAYVLLFPLNYASNAVAVTLVP